MKKHFIGLVTGIALLSQPLLPAYAEEIIAVETSFESPKLLTFKQAGAKVLATVEGNGLEGKEDFYKIVLNKNKKIKFTVDTNEEVMIFDLIDENKKKILMTHNDISSRDFIQDEIALPKGEYTIRLTANYADDVFPYKMTVELSDPIYYELEPNGDFKSANPILLNTRYYANIHQLKTIMDTFREVDYFKFDVPVAGLYGFNLPSSTNLYDSEQNYIRTLEYWDNTIKLNPGSYYLKMSYGTGPYFFEVNALPFKDVDLKHWAVKEIAYLSDQGIIKGYQDGSFNPNATVSRAQAATMIARALYLDTDNRPAPGFTDVPKNHWAYGAIAALVAEGIYPNVQKFNPNDPLTRDEMARILVNAYELTGKNNNEYTDVPGRHWAHNYISALAANKITTGYNDNTFKPNNPVTRAQFSSFMARVMDDRYLPVE
ncbi:S-layer homology domain-containing protein [Bacillus sp. FJAT-29790]|uniref:S-layer homology domain-containing protein n=1 Tax=Bacillus sp. FJAT-29790 TaxID=1895002 RepID=UPI001C242D0E|nr:S-layer homology domain-containing protein [Bacillus sp. FJAT-29790]MBU8881116.1 S-layer homology domain-containing protein [Bacillus sp. FJAT-29790]